jgi:hypothetical protein
MSYNQRLKRLGEALGMFDQSEIAEVINGIAANDPDAILDWARSNLTTELQTKDGRDDTVIIWK